MPTTHESSSSVDYNARIIALLPAASPLAIDYDGGGYRLAGSNIRLRQDEFRIVGSAILRGGSLDVNVADALPDGSNAIARPLATATGGRRHDLPTQGVYITPQGLRRLSDYLSTAVKH
jgi:hypothetical protein